MRASKRAVYRLATPAMILAIVAVTSSLVGPVSLVPSGGALAAVKAPAATTPQGSQAVLTNIVVTWNGKSISTAGSASSAFGLAKGTTAKVEFSFDEISGPSIANASLQLTYLGIGLTSSKARPAPAVTECLGCAIAQINWSFGSVIDALEGVFQLTASLLDTNGSSVWSESFYIFAETPYQLESGVVIILLVLALAELYWAGAAIRDARRGAQPPKGTPPSGSGGVTPSTPTPSGPDAASSGGPGGATGSSPSDSAAQGGSGGSS